MTLIEILIAVSLLSALTLAILFAMRIGLSTFAKASDKLMADRRVAGAQRVLEEELEGLMPVLAPCLSNPAAASQTIPFFQGDSASMRLVSTFSLEEAWRGRPRILEFAVIPGAEDRGVRLIVNELPYTGAASVGALCQGFAPDPVTRQMTPRFAPIVASAQSFVLADEIQFCRIWYLTPAPTPGLPPVWRPEWSFNGWPLGVRVEMAPLAPDPTRLEPISVTAALHVRRAPSIQYGDFP